MTVKTEGFRELDRALGELPKATAKNVLRRVAKAALEPMADAAAARAPVRSGRLSYSISVSEQRTRRVKRERKGAASFEMAMGPASGAGALSYASFDEFGTVDTQPQAYMRPAWDGGKERALDVVKDRLGLEIHKAAGRVAGKAARRG